MAAGAQRRSCYAWPVIALAASWLAGCDRTPPGPDLPGTRNPSSLSNTTESGRGSAAALPSFLDHQVPPHTQPAFVDCAAASGLDFTYYNDEIPGRYFLPEVMGGGAAWFDFDGDGWLDLYATNGCQLRPTEGTPGPHFNRLFRRVGADRFQDVAERSAAAADPGFGQGCAVGDFNADGFPDLYLANYGPNTLLLNNGDGTFDNITEASGTADALWGSSCLWADLDADGDLDLYVVNYLDVRFDNLELCRFQGKPGYCGPGNYAGQPDRVFVNQGDGTFRDGGAELGLRPAEPGKGLAVVALDLDGDQRSEIYVGNDMSPNFLFTRSRVNFAPALAGAEARPYREIGGPAGCAVSDIGHNEATMGLAWGDFDRDGQTDMFLSHFFQQKNTLYKNLGGLLFKDDSRRTRIAATSYDYLGFGTVAFDYDFDGALDLCVTNGHVLGPEQHPHAMTPQLLRNDGSGRFDDISAEAGDYFRTQVLGRGLAAADFDQDGDLDLCISHLHRPLALLRNDTPRGSGHYLGLTLASPDRVTPVGARVVATAGSRTWVVPYAAGGSYLSSHDPRLLLAFPSDDPVTLEVHWPGGAVDRWPDVALDQYVRLLPGREPQSCSVFAP